MSTQRHSGTSYLETQTKVSGQQGTAQVFRLPCLAELQGLLYFQWPASTATVTLYSRMVRDRVVGLVKGKSDGKQLGCLLGRPMTGRVLGVGARKAGLGWGAAKISSG